MQTGNENVRIVVPEGVTEFTLRQGVAVEPLKLKEAKSIALTGDIHAVAQYMKVRSESAQGIQVPDKSKAVVVVNKDAMTIVLDLDPDNYAKTTVTAKLEKSKELLKFGINEEVFYDRKGLLKELKFSRNLFDNQVTYNAVMASLMQVRMQTQAEMQQSSDNRGNRNNQDMVQVHAPDFVSTFVLNVPVYKGFPAEKIEVEICFEVRDNKIVFWLESVGLNDVLAAKIDGIFDAELKSVEGFVIIHQ
ncbi:MAG: hypothetical protein KF744_09215 [Taibaiella sp.]|nr:hypothetical protein [Taibaiella sp.]